LQYYKVVNKLLQENSPGEMLIDVGCHNTPIVLWGDFKRRVTIDLEPRPHIDGVEAIVGDWMQVQLPIATVTLCLQTLEHLTDDVIYEFATKVRQSADIIIVSVPFMWPAGMCHWHKQDPIDAAKLDRIMGDKSLSSEIVKDSGLNRLVCVYPSLKE